VLISAVCIAMVMFSAPNNKKLGYIKIVPLFTHCKLQANLSMLCNIFACITLLLYIK